MFKMHEILISLLKAILFLPQIYPADARICIARICAVDLKENLQKVEQPKDSFFLSNPCCGGAFFGHTKRSAASLHFVSLH